MIGMFAQYPGPYAPSVMNDTAAMQNQGYSPEQISQVLAAHASGALSDAGYNAIISGFVSADNLAGFLDQDPGAPAVRSLPQTSVPMRPPGQLPPGPAPRVSYPPSSSAFSWFSQSTLLTGIPNWGVLAGAVIVLPLIGNIIAGGGRRRR